MLSGRKHRQGSENVHSQWGKTLPMVVKPTMNCWLKFLVGNASRIWREGGRNTHSHIHIAFTAKQSTMNSKHQQRASISLICINKAPTKIPSVKYELWINMNYSPAGLQSLLINQCFQWKRRNIPDSWVNSTQNRYAHIQICNHVNLWEQAN